MAAAMLALSGAVAAARVCIRAERAVERSVAAVAAEAWARAASEAAAVNRDCTSSLLTRRVDAMSTDRDAAAELRDEMVVEMAAEFASMDCCSSKTLRS